MFIKTLMVGGLLGLTLSAGCKEEQAKASPNTATESAVIKGERAYAQTCAACHGINAQGMPNQGANLKTSPFIAGRTDQQLVEFIKTGRLPADPNSQLKLVMPPNGGNPSLSDTQLLQIVLYLRQVQREAGVMQTAGVSATP